MEKGHTVMVQTIGIIAMMLFYTIIIKTGLWIGKKSLSGKTERQYSQCTPKESQHLKASSNKHAKTTK